MDFWFDIGHTVSAVMDVCDNLHGVWDSVGHSKCPCVNEFVIFGLF